MTKAERLAPDTPDIAYSMAVSYFIADDFDQASYYVNRALQLNPSDDRALFLLGTSRFALGKLDESERLLDRAVQLKPQDQFHQCFYGMLLAVGVSDRRLDRQREYDAVKHRRELLCLQPQGSPPRCVLW